MPDVSVVMVTYNSASVVEAALSAVSGDPAVAACYAVDNASTDDTLACIRGKFPKVQLIANRENKGFGAANNQALAKISTEFALLLNPDAVPEKGAIAALVDAAKRYPHAAIVAPLLRSAGGEYETSFKRNVFHREKYRSVWAIPEGEVSAEFVSGAVMLLRMAHFKETGFFDPDIFFYYEDDDLCLRTRQAGHDIVVTPASVFIHHRGHSSAHSPELDAWKQRQLIASRIYLEKKHCGAVAARRLAARIRYQAMVKMALYRLLSPRKYAKHAARFSAAASAKSA